MREAGAGRCACSTRSASARAGAEERRPRCRSTERTRVMLARALAREPRLLVLDEPAPMPNLGERDRFYALLRAAARERGMALLVASEEMAALQGVRGADVDRRRRAAARARSAGTVVQLPAAPAAPARSARGGEHARAARRRQALLRAASRRSRRSTASR